jgi:hypothetical protein
MLMMLIYWTETDKYIKKNPETVSDTSKEVDLEVTQRKLIFMSYHPNVGQNYNSIQFNSILYFNVLTQQIQEPITESAQENKIMYR